MTSTHQKTKWKDDEEKEKEKKKPEKTTKFEKSNVEEIYEEELKERRKKFSTTVDTFLILETLYFFSSLSLTSFMGLHLREFN